MKKMKGYKAGGSLDPIPASNKGLPKLSTAVRNKMGYMGMGGSALESSMNGMMYKHGGSCGKKIFGKNLRKK
tara:strand:- start:635 stop:850 length:216 start_codon:yes stop_codon:yes gene_type:complete